MDERLENWIAAERLIAQYGPEAASVAKERARSLRRQGDAGGADMWELIHGCVRELRAGRDLRPQTAGSA
ncbi:MAG: hypothetical protein R3322_16035 [Kiloniellales bacterium]|jgi:hypothetical protein|nr:hypothetical protein [Kiloniellales bacterium]